MCDSKNLFNIHILVYLLMECFRKKLPTESLKSDDDVIKCISSFICEYIAQTLAMHNHDVNADVRSDETRRQQ